MKKYNKKCLLERKLFSTIGFVSLLPLGIYPMKSKTKNIVFNII